MDLKGFTSDLRIRQHELADLFMCNPSNVSNIISGKRNITKRQLKLLVEQYGFDTVKKYAEPEEISQMKSFSQIATSCSAPIQMQSGKVNTIAVDASLEEIIKSQTDIIKQLNDSLSRKDEQILRKDEQIAFLHGLIDKKMKE